MNEELREIENTEAEVVDIYKQAFGVAKTISKELREFKDEFQKDKSNNTLDDNQPTEKNISKILDNEVTGFTFTGQYTDLCYFHQSESMPISAIANIPDENIKNAVVKTFDKAIADGELEIKNGFLSITDKGKKIINEPAFIKLSKESQLQAYNSTLNNQFKSEENEIQMCVELSGDYKNDFTFFTHSDNLDLNQILNHPNKELSAKILSNVRQWQEKGAVTVNKNGIATITPNAKKMLELPEFQNTVKGLSEKNLQSVKAASKQIIVSTKKAAQITTEIAKKAAKNVILKK